MIRYPNQNHTGIEEFKTPFQQKLNPEKQMGQIKQNNPMG